MYDIDALELHYSNLCTHNCRICSKHHGNQNMPKFAVPGYTERIISQVKSAGLKIKAFQLGGDGDPFINPGFLKSLRQIRANLTSQRLCLYTNFEMITPDIANILVRERLIDEINVRFDTANPLVYNWHTYGNFSTVIENIRYFCSINDHADFWVIYFPVYKYEQIVRDKLNKAPTYFKNTPVKLVEEEREVRALFESMNPKKFNFRRSGCNLWAERSDCAPAKNISCHHVDGFGFDHQMLIYPNGDCGLCAYCDTQNELIYGNIFKSDLRELWKGKARKDMIEYVRSGKPLGAGSCINNNACRFYGC